MTNFRHIVHRLRKLAAKLDRSIAFDRSRDGMGQFAPEDDSAGPDAMAAAYGEPANQQGVANTVLRTQRVNRGPNAKMRANFRRSIELRK